MRALLFVFLIISMLMLSCDDYGDSTAPLSPQATDHLMQEGDSLFSADNYEEAIVKYQECLTACRTRKDTTGMSDCYFQLSTIYQRLGNISMSIEMAKECLHLDSLTNKAENLSSTYNTLAALYYSSKDIASARKFINLAATAPPVAYFLRSKPISWTAWLPTPRQWVSACVRWEMPIVP